MGWKAVLGGVGGGIIGNTLSYQQGKQKESTQRHWLEKMRSTSHQAEMDDLRKAGLNPILTATGGKGATSPSYQSHRPPEYGKGVTSAVQVGNQAALIKAQTKHQQAITREQEVNAQIAEMALSMMRKDKGTERAVGAGYLSRKANVRGEVGIPAFGAHSARQALQSWFRSYMERNQATIEKKRSTKKPRPDIKPMKVRRKTEYERKREARNRD